MQLETITITLPLGVSLTSPIAELERAIYPQHAGLATLIGRVQDEELATKEAEQEADASIMAAERRADAMASALETLCDAIDELDEASEGLEIADEQLRARVDVIVGKLLSASETARCEL